MMLPVKQQWKVAVLDMYEGVANEGMRCIREILADYSATHGLQLQADEFEIRLANEVPDLSYDIYISTGGPGSPVDSAGSDWEKAYFGLVQDLIKWNESAEVKKPMLFICHSFQLMCRYFELGQVCRRRSPAFGVFPVHKTHAGELEPLLQQLPEPFYVVDSRNWQVIGLQPAKLQAMGAQVLAIEKERPHVPLERAVMAIRFNAHFLGTQFHPEADAAGMRKYLLQDDKRQHVAATYGAEKYESMLEQLTDPGKITLTHNRFIPTLLNDIILGPLSQVHTPLMTKL
ncbi:GMP synthase-Glutamine amidotransferase [Chitinophaga rupis]|uniref:GMP synthase-Glutamine amidotransferase n=1 Tax=Chitinophaga rupis TaxID=573321 RepID=A0A1H7UN64_9BACT|nr:homoserine O-succinyltransferase [Chitinophaga rupis]SEL98403.1 GMP synthase-Glutamine amidotransferase [Chitinophaga rupis]